MPTFNDSEAKQFSVNPGDYILQILGFDKKISHGAKTNGCDLFEIKVGVEVDGRVVCEIYESLVDHESIIWKWDVMLKSCGVKIAKGESYTIFKPDATDSKRFIEIRGLRGWGTLRMKPPKTAGEQSKFNEIAAWITNKAKLEPVRFKEEEHEEEPF